MEIKFYIFIHFRTSREPICRNSLCMQSFLERNPIFIDQQLSKQSSLDNS